MDISEIMKQFSQMQEVFLREKQVRATQEICIAKSLEKAGKIYLENLDVLKGWKFIYSTPKGNTTAYSSNHSFSSTGALRNFFKHNEVFFIDEKLTRKTKGRYAVVFDYSIGLDANAVSYIEPYIDANISRIPKDIEEVMVFLAGRYTNFDPLPYLEENFFGLHTPVDYSKVFKSLKAYNKLRFAELQSNRNGKRLIFKLTDQQINDETSGMLSSMMHKLTNQNIVNELKKDYLRYYVLLLKMIEIHFSSKQDVNKKLKEFFLFMHHDINAIHTREALLAKEFFIRKQKLKFFAKIQPRNKNLFRDLRNMAWDIKHIRGTEFKANLLTGGGVDYFIPAFLTFDSRLVEVIDLVKINALSISPDGDVTPFYHSKTESFIYDLIQGFPDKNDFLETHFSLEARECRVKSRRLRPYDFYNGMCKLEEKVASLLEINVPPRVW